MNGIAQTLKTYQGVPETPGPRQNRTDKQIYYQQKKLEAALHLLNNELEKQRGRLLAGRQSYNLKPRADFDHVKLLDNEEEEKVRKGKAEAARRQNPFNKSGGQNWRPRQSSQRPNYQPNRSNSQGRKGGKGRGKGKGGNKKETQG